MVKSCRSTHKTSPHRLVDQDVALSRLKLGFESPRGHSEKNHSHEWFFC